MRKETILAIFLISFTLAAGYVANYFLIQSQIQKIQKKPSLKIFGTEYNPQDSGRVFLQLLDENFQPINNALCLISVYYPNKTEWFRNVSMFHLPGSDGLYYFDFIAPSIEGVYMVSAKCFYLIEETFDYADNAVAVQGLASGSWQDTWKDDNIFYTVIEKKAAGGYALDFYFEFYNVSIPSNYTGMTIYWIGRWNDPQESVYMYIYDWCSNSWAILPNSITTNTPTLSNYLDASIYDVNCLIASNGTVRVRFRDSDQAESQASGTLQTDYIDVQAHYATYGQVGIVRGGGEIHVSVKVAEPSEEVPFITIVS